MSGIIGVYSVDGNNIFEELSYGLIALQHRGDRGFGFCVDNQDSDPNNWFLHESGRGLVFYDMVQNNPEKIKELSERKPTVGIGHTLYEKTGGLQPRGTWNIKGYDMMVAMDGVLLGYPARDEVVMRAIVSKSLSEADDFFKAGELIMEEFDGRGPYNVVANIRDYRNGEYYLVAFRDPKGIKPMCLGCNGDKYIIASESKIFQNIDADFVRDVEPGEMIVISKKGMKDRVLVRQDHAHCAFEWVYFASPVSDIEGKNVYLVRKKLGESLAKRYPDVDIDQVICSPDSGRGVATGFQQALNRRRLQDIIENSRGMKNKKEIIKYLESDLQDAFVPFEEGVEKNPTAPRTFQIEEPILREIASRTKFYFNEQVLKDKKSGVGDDSIVRGSVFKYGMAPKAKRLGAKTFGAIISCPPLSHACVKDPGGKTFAALGLRGPVEKIGERVAEDIGLDFVLYPTEEDLDKAIGFTDTCKACFNGKYPVKKEFLPEDQLR
jgi:amidophosphoribosyltransferase